MDSESAAPTGKASSPSPSESPSLPPPPAAAALSDTSDSESDDASPQVEWLATARERRSTAGNRMKSMLAAEEPDDDLELLFAEDDNDQGFSDGGDHASDVQMDSSSDEEDNNNATGADDLEGEKELEKQAKEKRAAQRKRKAQDAHIPAKFRKKVRINAEAPAPRPKKKSERASWLPSVADLPTRASARSTTRMSKEQLHSQMVEREERRLKQVAQMQKKAAKLEAMRKPPMTQEERLREAEKVEQRNKGSLNRWEEAEKAREEERLRKLKALTERRLEGPVITFWSGVREGQVRYVEMEEKPVRKKREKPAKTKGSAEKKEGDDGEMPKPDGETDTQKVEVEKAEPEKNGVEEGTAAPVPVPEGPKLEIDNTKDMDALQDKPESKPPEATLATDGSVKQSEGEDSKNVSTTASPAPPGETTESVVDANPDTEKEATPAKEQPAADAALADDSQQSQSQPRDTLAPPGPSPPGPSPPGPSPQLPEEQHPKASTPTNPESKSDSLTAPTAPGSAAPPQTTTNENSHPSSVLAAPDTTQSSVPPPAPSSEAVEKNPLPFPIDTTIKEAASATQSEQPTPKAETADESTAPNAGGITERAPRNAIVFQNFNENVIKDKSIQTQILFGQKMAKLSKPTPSPLCVITNRPARYRDPSTGLPFATSHAYHEIHRLIRGDYKWSRLLGAWVGTGTYAARGVPERFLNPNALSAKKKQEEEEKKKLDDTKKEEAVKPVEVEEEKKADTVVAGGDITMGEAPSVTAV